MNMKDLAGAAALVAVLSVPSAGQERPIDVDRLGPQIGERVPDFRLQDQDGRMRTRDSIMGPNGALIVFSRSVDWCPYCKTQMLDLQNRLPELERQGLAVAAVTYDSPTVMADFAARRGITFPLLSDPGSSVIREYGILNTTVEKGSLSDGIPFPGTFVVDRRGVVTARFFEEAYQERTTVASMLLSLGAGGRPVAATHIETDHLQATTYVTDDVVAPGSLFSVVFDITPRDGMHVYAPGDHDYRVITLILEPNPLVDVRPVDYPASEIYHFAPLDERVPVYQRPFRLTQAMAVTADRVQREALARMETITIEGTLDYQACDDKICYRPRSVPVSYTLKMRGLDTERANAPQ